METKSNSLLIEEPVRGLMVKYAVPCIISLLVGALYNIVDQIFIANAANTAVFLLTVIALAIAVMTGDGCCAFVSLSLGKNQPEEAGKSMGNAILLTVLLSLVPCAVYLMFSGQIIAMFGVGFALLLPKFYGLDGLHERHVYESSTAAFFVKRKRGARGNMFPGCADSKQRVNSSTKLSFNFNYFIRYFDK